MITHVFNSSIVSGPETLVLPAIKNLSEPVSIVFLTETRLPEGSRAVLDYARSLGHVVKPVPVRGRWDRRAFKDLRRTLDELAPRIVHAHDVKASLYAWQAKRSTDGFKPALVSTHHGASYRKGKIRLYEEIYVRAFLPRFDLALCVCEADRRSLAKRGVPEEKLALHPNGVDRKKIRASERAGLQRTIRDAWREKRPDLPPSDRAVYLGAVARLSPEKRHDRMIRVLRQLIAAKRIRKEPILLVFGAGPELERLRALAREEGVENNVHWMGYSKTICEEMAGFDVLLSLSDGEGIPVNVLEAGWAGTPVLATSVGGIPDIIPSSDSGILVDRRASDAAIALELEAALSNEERLRWMAHAFQKRVTEKFSQSAWLRALENFYGHIGGSFSPSARSPHHRMTEE